MKRLLILLGLMAVLLVPQMAQAAPFYFGQNSGSGMSFDDSADVKTNLEYLYSDLLGISNPFTEKTLSDFDLGKSWEFSAVGFSYHAAMKGLSASVGIPGIGEEHSAIDGMRFQDKYLASQIEMSWFFDDRHDNDTMTLAELITTCVSAVYVLDRDISFTLDGDSEAFTFVAGTIFFGITLPGGSTNAVDFIMAAGPMSPPSVPVPAAVWLMGTGVAGVVALRRKMK